MNAQAFTSWTGGSADPVLGACAILGYEAKRGHQPNPTSRRRP